MVHQSYELLRSIYIWRLYSNLAKQSSDMTCIESKNLIFLDLNGDKCQAN